MAGMLAPVASKAGRDGLTWLLAGSVPSPLCAALALLMLRADRDLFGIEPQFWLNLQAQYDIEMVLREQGERLAGEIQQAVRQYACRMGRGDQPSAADRNNRDTNAELDPPPGAGHRPNTRVMVGTLRDRPVSRFAEGARVADPS